MSETEVLTALAAAESGFEAAASLANASAKADIRTDDVAAATALTSIAVSLASLGRLLTAILRDELEDS